MPATIVGDLSDEETIWRYMTLDRLINILDDNALFMTGLGAYSKSDPYEGHPPARRTQASQGLLPTLHVFLP